LAVAVKVFFQFGYRKTSMEDVAAVAEVIADTLTQAGTAARWERHGIGAQNWRGIFPTRRLA